MFRHQLLSFQKKKIRNIKKKKKKETKASQKQWKNKILDVYKFDRAPKT
jgi:hypothetical protein